MPHIPVGNHEYIDYIRYKANDLNWLAWAGSTIWLGCFPVQGVALGIG